MTWLAGRYSSIGSWLISVLLRKRKKERKREREGERKTIPFVINAMQKQ